MQNSSMNFSKPISQPVKILVVDDHPNTAALLARAISKLGNRVEVLSATSGHEALEHVQRDSADILITDMDMPDMTGLELIERLQTPMGHPILSLLITAAYMPELDLTAHQLNVREVLRKPIHPQKICQLISQILEEKES
jgi:CheY-like chemotaxis protein